jgi:hypothetical protein
MTATSAWAAGSSRKLSLRAQIWIDYTVKQLVTRRNFRKMMRWAGAHPGLQKIVNPRNQITKNRHAWRKSQIAMGFGCFNKLKPKQ